MSGYSAMDNMLVLETLESYDFTGSAQLCDIGGGHGSTLCHLLVKYPHLQGTVLELPGTLDNADLLWANKLGVGDRCRYVAGDMFRTARVADIYMVKRVLHDWNDEECQQILSAIQRSAPPHAKVLIMEQVVPGPETPHFSKLFDIHMLLASTGRERTLEEYCGLLTGSGWQYRQTWYPASRMLGIIEGLKA